MKIFTFIMLAMFSFGTLVFAQIPDTLWTKTYGGASADWGIYVQETSDFGYIIAGNTESFGAGSTDVYLIKTNYEGDTLWTKTYGGAYADAAYCVQQTTDGGYIIVGQTASYGSGGNDIWLIKTDGSGNVIWMKTFGGNYNDTGISVKQTADGGYIVSGNTDVYGNLRDDVYIIKTDSLGNAIWTTMWNRPDANNADRGGEIQLTDDGGYIMVGHSYNSGGTGIKATLLKLDSLGTIEWWNVYGNEIDQRGSSVLQTADGGYIFSAYTGLANPDFWLVRTDNTGDTIWTKRFGGPNDEYPGQMYKTADTGYVIVGYTASYGSGGNDVWLVKTDNNGNELWNQPIGSAGNERGVSVQQTADEGLIIAGRTNSSGSGDYDIWLLKLQGINPIAYYPFTGNANDSSGNGYNGISHGAQLVNDRFGNTASAYQFDGINQYIELPSAITITADLSLSFWVRTSIVDTNNWPGARFLVDRDVCSGARDWSIGLGKGGKIQFQTGTGSLDDVLTSSTDVNDNSWHHVAVVRNTFEQSKKIYVDGQLDTTSSFDNLSFINNNKKIFIAATVCDPGLHKYFPGVIDDIRIYDQPVTEQLVLMLYYEKGWVPVELTLFNASVIKNSVTLTWTTKTELNNQGFQVERCRISEVNGQVEWVKIGYAPGSGTTTIPRSYSFIDKDLEAGKYAYRLKQIDFNGTYKYSEERIVEINSTVPSEFSLEQNYPNPFNPTTNIRYTLPVENHVTLKIYNLLGEEVTTLVNEAKEAGSYEVEFSTKGLTSGIYFYTLQSGVYTQTKKMLILK